MTVVNVLARKIRNLNFGGNANTTWPRSTQTSHVAVAVAVAVAVEKKKNSFKIILAFFFTPPLFLATKLAISFV